MTTTAVAIVTRLLGRDVASVVMDQLSALYKDDHHDLYRPCLLELLEATRTARCTLDFITDATIRIPNGPCIKGLARYFYAPYYSRQVVSCCDINQIRQTAALRRKSRRWVYCLNRRSDMIIHSPYIKGCRCSRTLQQLRGTQELI